MNDLQAYFDQNKERVMQKWNHYFDIYDRHFSKYRGKEIVILEIGTYSGGSLQMWKSYFGNKAKIYSIDINPECKQVEEENVKVFIGSQSDREFLNKVIKEIGPVDILIDDGGHTMLQQIVSSEELFHHVKPDGVYLCEDLHTSYWKEYGGGYKRKGTFIEYSKNFIDELNAYHSVEKELQVSDFTTSVNSIHYYDSVIVIEKKDRPKPHTLRTGTINIPEFEFVKTDKEKKEQKRRIKRNKWLARFKLPFQNGDF
jgi:hypothetical protein